jgi:hypothetical protein
LSFLLPFSPTVCLLVFPFVSLKPAPNKKKTKDKEGSQIPLPCTLLLLHYFAQTRPSQ